jgi:sulfite reductase beta subunit-like hemoprotein
MVLENRILRRISRPKREQVAGHWRRLHNVEHHNLNTQPNVIRVIRSRRMRWAGHIALTGQTRNAYKILVGKTEGKRQLGRRRRKWENHTRIDLRKTGWEGVDWLSLAQDRNQ